MKKLTLIATMVLVVSAFASGDGFCEGWAAGYAQGYCYGKSACLEPLTPLCPLPRLGEDSFQGGYNRGFLAGLANQR